MHCPPELLGDLTGVLDQVRALPHVVENKPGIFYVRRVAFLHFHLTKGVRSADVRSGKTWGPRIDIPADADDASRAAFLAEVRRRYEETARA